MMDWINTNFYRDWGYGLAYPQLFPHHKRRSDEAHAEIEWGRNNSQNWVKLLNDHWIGPTKQYLCGDAITIADYFGAGIVTLGELIGCDFSPYPDGPALARQHQEAAELGQGQRAFLRPARGNQGADLRADLNVRRLFKAQR